MKELKHYFLFIGVLILSSNCTTYDKSLVVHFDSEMNGQSWTIEELNAGLSRDWSTHEYLTFDIFASSTQRFTFTLHDTAGPRKIVILPFQNTWVRASIPLIHFKERNVIGHDMAAIWKTPLPGMCINFTGTVGSIDNIESISFEMDNPLNSPYIEIRNFQLTMNSQDSILGPLPAVNEFGQWLHDESYHNFNSLEELANRWNEDDGGIISGDFDFSKFGGFMKKRVKPTGFFRTERIDGRWWLIDPQGYLFYSIGSTGINPGISFERVKGREYIYKELPPAIKGTGTRDIENSFYTWNLIRRYGEGNWINKWIDKTIYRMDIWGFNTIANWSDPTLCQSQRKPYVKNLYGWGFNAETMGMPDPYDPAYIQLVEASAKAQCEPLKNDPFLIGYFVGNEPPWPGREDELVNVILKGEATPLQTALKEHLAKGDTPEARKSFVYETYIKFITIINSAIKKYDPNHLNLGLRFGGHPPVELTKLSADIGFDVYSLNIYNYSIRKELLVKIEELTNLPIMIGEFHFGTPGRGLAPGLAQTINQKERGVAYRYYVEQAAAHPSVVGTHWFQWLDQPSTGRFDGENYNIGFLDVTDLPYSELVNEAIKTHERIFDIHSGKEPPVNQQAIIR
ncbi:hypothetical protein SAMN05216365_1017 [Porphyromonadaceae bacterium NLAE-zl-C104]|nr:hypothetical protein SAMN05216365_1017 [Porphyromonadaceae bacterium NLAE-zl-C104]